MLPWQQRFTKQIIGECPSFSPEHMLETCPLRVHMIKCQVVLEPLGFTSVCQGRQECVEADEDAGLRTWLQSAEHTGEPGTPVTGGDWRTPWKNGMLENPHSTPGEKSRQWSTINKNSGSETGVQLEDSNSKTASHWLLPEPQSEMAILFPGNSEWECVADTCLPQCHMPN